MKNSALKTVENRILNSNDQDKIWSYPDFNDLPFDSATKALSVLCNNGAIKRVQKGFYYRPKQTILGEVPPDYLNLLFIKLSKKADFYCVSGLNGYNKIGLTTQIPNTITIACDSPMRSTDKIRFIRRRRPHSGTDIERVVLDALNDIDSIPGITPKQALLKIKDLIKTNKVNINDLGHSALYEVPRIKAIIGALGQELGMDKNLLKQIKDSLNPGTVYFLDAAYALKYANNWNIKVKR